MVVVWYVSISRNNRRFGSVRSLHPKFVIRGRIRSAGARVLVSHHTSSNEPPLRFTFDVDHGTPLDRDVTLHAFEIAEGDNQVAFLRSNGHVTLCQSDSLACVARIHPWADETIHSVFFDATHRAWIVVAQAYLRFVVSSYDTRGEPRWGPVDCVRAEETTSLQQKNVWTFAHSLRFSERHFYFAPDRNSSMGRCGKIWSLHDGSLVTDVKSNVFLPLSRDDGTLEGVIYGARKEGGSYQIRAGTWTVDVGGSYGFLDAIDLGYGVALCDFDQRGACTVSLRDRVSGATRWVRELATTHNAAVEGPMPSRVPCDTAMWRFEQRLVIQHQRFTKANIFVVDAQSGEVLETLALTHSGRHC
jgi:hypothetical protein